MIDAIVLAAGLSTRMGVDKPLLVIDGEAAVARVVRRVREAGIARPIVVLGAQSAERIRATVDLTGCCVAVNDAPEAGMGGSLRLGLDATSPNVVGVVVLHADMPFVRSETIRGVIREAERGARIVAPTYRGRRGFPVFFHRTHLPGLRRALSGDRGGRAYIDAHRGDLVTFESSDPGSVFDIDRPADLGARRGDAACATSG